MNLEYLFSPTKQFTYPSGKLLDGGKIFVYFKDTTNLATLYSPEGSFVSNPILLDANGRASVRADVTYQYRLEVYTNKDVLIYTCEAFRRRRKACYSVSPQRTLRQKRIRKSIR